MLSFHNFLNEEVAPSAGNAGNTTMGDAYEMGTVLHIHNNTAAKQNKDKAYVAKIADLKKKHKVAMSKLSPEKQADVQKKSEDSATAYLGSLAKHEGIKPEHIHEVHHTNLGISQHVGHDVVRADNPHDLIIKGKKGRSKFLHGASLKATSGTASNNASASFERQAAAHGMATNTTKSWTEGKKKAGLAGKSAKEVKEVRKDPKVIAANQTAQQNAAAGHAAAFNKAKPAQQKEHILHFLKAHPDVPYHYVVGEKGGKSTPIDQHPAVAALNKAKKITATVKNNNVHFHDERGNHIATAEHRTTHGAFSSPQTNFKFGSVKAPSND
jgi:hypothetical protein